ncbi:DUF3131 domain-containing protein [Aliiroseovarius subalbicans]|uniref:DUF3131 domain-containing protein n=1 Tax=Aliiroseovarius subalbicans TaxID=2925840 RepID=UPI001F583E03|nr:DUF3131 domain-containing protein [Aliiroseovarius subalbicans]MCI2399910.1 DUF3131 domain-containing protein [Aliiroseovarius subalbicans]
MDRRTFLSRAFISGAAAISPSWRPAHAASTFPCILFINGVTPDTSPSDLFAFLDPIISQNVPISITVKFDREEQEKADRNVDLMRFLFTMTTEYPGLVDLALELPDIATLTPYLRMRSASEARNRFRRSLVAAAGQESLGIVPHTIVSGLPSGQVPTIEGLRSAGVLNTFLLPEEGETPEIWRNSDGTQQINGGWRLPPLPTSEEIAGIFTTATSSEGTAVFAAKFPGNDLQGEGELFNQGAILGDAFRRYLISSRNYFILPSELRFRSGDVFPRHLVLCIQSDGVDASEEELGTKLTAAGVPFTEVRRAFEIESQAPDEVTEETNGQETHKCIQVSEADEGKWQQARKLAFENFAKDATNNTVGPVTCAATDDEYDSSANTCAHAGFEIVLSLSNGGEQFSGFDECGALRLNTSLVLDGPFPGLSTQILRERIELAASPSEDVVLLVPQKGFSKPDDASALVEALVGIGKSGQFNLLDMGQHLATVTVKSEQARLLRAARRWPARQDTDEMNAAKRGLLIDDAKSAWSFIERLTNPDTGLVPATAWLENDATFAYEFSTMWDNGSLVLAILSAHSIGLLSDAEFSTRIEAVLGGLATGVFNGLRLPKGLTSTDGAAYGDDKYNASDTARLLVSLHLLKKYAKTDLGIDGILDGWDLNETIRDGVPLTVRGSRLVSSYRSNYAGYIARAFGLWGYPVSSPYSDPKPGSAFDQGVDVLHEVAEFGPIGTEPHLLEAVELGASDLASVASDALFAAQVEEYLSTGKLVCVSEGPVNREPWFVYQGYQIGEDQDHWTFETLDPSPRFKTKGFIRAIDMLNSKAAFLWSAHRPGEYSDLLIARVREKAKAGPLGFSPGVFSVTGTSDQVYSDINTNSVILEAIAYRLNGGKPCAEWNSER